MNPMPIAAEAHDDAARWRAWQLAYVTSSRRGAVQSRIAFAILLTVVAAWLSLQLLTMPV